MGIRLSFLAPNKSRRFYYFSPLLLAGSGCVANAPSFRAKPNSVCITSPLPQMTASVQTPLKSARNSKAELSFLKGELEGARAGRGPAQGAEGEARSHVPAVEPRKPGNNPLAAELCEVSRSASSPVFIYSARVCAWPGAGGVVGKAKLCSRNTEAAGGVGPRVPRADQRHLEKLQRLAPSVNLPFCSTCLALPKETRPLAGALHENFGQSPSNITAFGVLGMGNTC